MGEATERFGQSDVVLLSNEDAAVALVERSVTGLWDVVNELTRLRRTTRQNYRVTIFVSARIQPRTFAYEQVRQCDDGWPLAIRRPQSVPSQDLHA